MGDLATNRMGRIESTDGTLWWVKNTRRDEIGNLVRCFPDTSPNTWLSLRHSDGHELALIRNLDDLDSDSLAAVRLMLHEKYHSPTIVRILSINLVETGKHIRVETQDGPGALDITSEADADFSNYPAITITDQSRQRKYKIEDAADMDRGSRDLIRRHLRTRGRRGRGVR
ncbi:MAG: DUF1854 domain-containing protein [Candidatus Latescibacterota bacterium]|nr:DUF1854 domain-containing protein [Candidatus Latescibacterota bacterium]